MKNIDNKVQDNYLEKKVYVGVVLNIGLHNYFAPLSSYKTKQDTIKNNDTIFKLHSRTNVNDRLGLIQINNMVPVLTSELEEIDFKKEDKQYAGLLQKQYEFILSNEETIKLQAKKLYHRIVDKKDLFYSKISFDFLLLEKEYINYKK